MKRLKTIFIAGFPGNHILAKPLIDYMQAFTDVYHIDLPGFARDIPPLEHITFSNFSDYIAEQIRRLDLDEYIICTLSMGFRLANDIQIDKRRCRGIVALEPYTDSRCLCMGGFAKRALVSLIDFGKIFESRRLIWRKSLISLVFMLDRRPMSFADGISQQDCRSFMEAGRACLTYLGDTKFHDIPYVLVMNKADEVLRYNHVHKIFREGARRLLVVNETLAHFPRNPTQGYLRANFPEKDILRIIEYINHNRRYR